MTGTAPAAAPQTDLTGRVASFDAHVGLGEIRADSGDTHMFHCVEIADGTRDIAVDTEVTFDHLHKFGRVEAANIRH